MDWLPLQQQREASAAIAKLLLEIEPQNWTLSQMQVAGKFVLPPALASKMRMVAVELIESPLRKTAKSESLSGENSAVIVEFLAKTPTTADYEVFLLATAASDRLLAKHGWSGLRKLPIQDATRELEACGLLLAACNVSSIDQVDVSQVKARIRNVAGRLKLNDVPATQAPWDAWKTFYEGVFKDPQASELVRLQWAELQKPPAAWVDLVKESQKLEGDEDRGSVLFKRAQCNQCHNSSTAIGPSLDGITRRFSYDDLFKAIYEPSRDISDRFRATKVLTTDNQVITGMVNFDGESEVGLTLADGSSRKIKKDEIEERAESDISMMPENLIQGWSPAQLADLYEYLRGM